MDTKTKKGEYMCRTVEEITEQNLVVQQLDTVIEKNNDDESVLIHKVLRLNLISHEQNNDNQSEILDHVKIAKKNPSLVWLLRFKFLKTSAVIIIFLTIYYVVFHLVEYSIGFDEIIKAVIP